MHCSFFLPVSGKSQSLLANLAQPTTQTAQLWALPLPTCKLPCCALTLLLLDVGANYYSSANRMRRRSLSNCADRLAQAGLELSAGKTGSWLGNLFCFAPTRAWLQKQLKAALLADA